MRCCGWAVKAVIVLMLLAVTGCVSSGGTESLNDPPPGGEPVTGTSPFLAGIADMPFPDAHDTALEETGRAPSSITDFGLDGADHSWHTASVVDNGTSADFTPAGGESAWAIYRFLSLADADTPLGVTVAFTDPSPAEWYFGVADYTEGCWCWSSGSGSGTKALPAGHDLVTDAGYLYAVVLTWDGTAASLANVTLAADINDAAPVAKVTADPGMGNATLSTQFDASGSYDRDAGGITEYRWDFNGDGTVDQSSATDTATFNYGNPGLYTMIVEVADGDGLTDCAAYTVRVHGWARTFGNNDIDVFNDMAVDGNLDIYAVGGTTFVSGGTPGILVTKYNRFGETCWHRAHDGTYIESAQAVKRLPDGTMLVGGHSLNHGQGGYDILLININSDGEVLWARTWGGTESEQLRDMAVGSDGYIYITGWTMSDGAGVKDVLIGRFHPDGTPDWTRTWGMSANEDGRALVLDADDNIYIAGQTSSLNDPMTEAIMLKLDSAGNLLLPLIISEPDHESANCIGVDFSGNIYLGGEVWSGDWPMRLIKFDSTGVLKWSRTWDNGDWCVANDMVVTGSLFTSTTIHLVGNCYGASSDKDVLWMTLDNAGTVNQAKAFVAADLQHGYSITRGPDYTYMVSGWAQDNNGVWLDVVGTSGTSSPSLMTSLLDVAGITGISEVQDITLAETSGTEDTGGGGLYDGLAMCYYEDDL